MIYGIDFDGTIVENNFPLIGTLKPEAVEFIRELQKRGDKWILITMREDEKLGEALVELASNDLYPDAVNDNLPEMCEFYQNNPRKIFAHVYIDDHNAGGLRWPKQNRVEGIVEKAMRETQDKLVDKIFPRPKLTADIFNHPHCPDWAEFAAVDKDGKVWGFALEPSTCCDVCCWYLTADDYKESCFIDEGFDASDWKNSLVQRVRYTSDGVVHVRFKKLHPDAKAPYQATPGSAGFDLTAVSMKKHKESVLRSLVEYGTGLAVEIPAGHVGLVFPRSSIYKKQMVLTNGVGVIDSDYRGEIKAVFAYGGQEEIYQPGDRIAQLVIMPIPAVKFEEAEELTETERGAGGYGSTGK